MVRARSSARSGRHKRISVDDTANPPSKSNTPLTRARYNQPVIVDQAKPGAVAPQASVTLVRLKALANDIRFDILKLLALGEHCVCDLESALDLPQSKVSYHLAVLKDAGFVTGESRGKNSYYTLRRDVLYTLGGEMLREVLAHDGDMTTRHVPNC